MAKVTYLNAGGLAHHNNPSGTTYIFQTGVPLEVKTEDAQWYALEATRGGPWKADLGIVEQAAEAVSEVKEEVKEAIKPNKGKGGKR